ncbi:MAG: alpha/beta hydrolase, partial [Leadbetterella sp.]|nr:alpha/beta hydrolase [Leadbetterella sp.]
MKSVTFRNKNISYSVDGQGDCLVLLHGFPMDSRVWDNSKPRFSEFYTVICIDLPGFGKSEMISDTHSMSLMAQAVNAVLTEENIEKCVMVGHSMGGYVALDFTNQFPEKLMGLIFLHS